MHQVVSSLSTGLMGTYDRCRPKERYLTKPSEGTHNEGFDNDNHDLVVYMDMVLDTPNTRYLPPPPPLPSPFPYLPLRYLQLSSHCNIYRSSQ